MTTIYLKLFTILLLFMISFSSAGSAQVVLRLALQLPLEHHLSQNLMSFKSEVENRSNGRIKVVLLEYGALLEAQRNKPDEFDQTKPQRYFKDEEINKAVSDGLIEAGIVSLPRFSKSIPLVDIFYQPFLLDTKRKVINTVSRESPVRKEIEKAIAKTGATVLWWQSYGSVVFVSNEGSIRRPDHLKDKRVRVFGETLGNLILVSGGTPMAIPNSKERFSYEYDKVDLGMTTISEIRRKKIWEVMDTISITNSANIQFVTVVNSAWWRNLGFQNKKIISDAVINAEKRAAETINQIEADSYKEVIQNGMKLVILSDDDRDYWKEKSEPIYRKFFEQTGQQGMELFLLISNY